MYRNWLGVYLHRIHSGYGRILGLNFSGIYFVFFCSFPFAEPVEKPNRKKGVRIEDN